jgi:hypothetical protein
VGREPPQKLTKAQKQVVEDIYEEIEMGLPYTLTPIQQERVKHDVEKEVKLAEDEFDMSVDEFLRQLGLGFPEEEEEEEEEEYSGNGLSGGALSIVHIKKMLKASYQNAPSKIDDFILDPELSGQYGVVYYNPITGQAVVVHRGTKEAMDWTNNLMYAVGKYKWTNRYQSGLRMQRMAEKKYGANNISTLGHSQGAVLARELGQNTKEIITLNPAYKGEKPLKNEYNIRSSGDVVSSGLWGTKRSHDLIIPSKGFNVVGEHMIDILDRVDQNKMIGSN